jgi:hypothetical protein
LAVLDWSKIDLKNFQEAMKKAADLPIQPQMLMPNQKSDVHYKLVWLSQIAQVMSQHVSDPGNPLTAISLKPPVIEQVSRVPPKIWMLKLTDAPKKQRRGYGAGP